VYFLLIHSSLSCDRDVRIGVHIFICPCALIYYILSLCFGALGFLDNSREILGLAFHPKEETMSI